MNINQYKGLLRSFQNTAQAVIELEMLEEEFRGNDLMLYQIEKEKDKLNEVVDGMLHLLRNKTEMLFGVKEDDFDGNKYYELWLDFMNKELSVDDVVELFEYIGEDE